MNQACDNIVVHIMLSC